MIELCSEYLSVRCIWLYLLIMSRTRFRVNPLSIVAWMSRNSLLEAGAKSEVLSDCSWTRTQTHLVRKRTLNHLSKLTKWLSWVPSTYLRAVFFLSCHVLQSLKLQILRLLRARTFLTFRQLYSADSLWNVYVIW